MGPEAMIAALIATIRATPDCAVRPPAQMPQVDADFAVPPDILAFYRHCGGVALFASSSYGLTIVPPEGLVVANPVIFVGVDAADLAEFDAHPSRSWHLIAEGPHGMYTTIDLAPDRLGTVYDSHWDVDPHDSAVIASSFADLLTRALAARGGEWWW